MANNNETFANTINSLGNDNFIGMSACEKFGITWGCRTNCPVLMAGKCGLKDTDNKELYEECKQEFDLE